MLTIRKKDQNLKIIIARIMNDFFSSFYIVDYLNLLEFFDNKKIK